MSRQLSEAPTASDSTSSYKSILWFLRQHELEAKVYAAGLMWLILRSLQNILGPMRRRSRHWLVQYGAMAAYYLPTLILFYTANAIYSSDSDKRKKVILYSSCLAFLTVNAQLAGTMTAFTLGDGPLIVKSWRMLALLLYLAWLVWGLIWRDRRLTVSDLYYIFTLSVLAVNYILVARPREDNLEYETKEFADHMMCERSSLPSPFFNDDANSSLYDRCRYPFFKLQNDQWVNFSDVLQQRQRGRLTGDPDVCLSYSFCRLLARRYFMFPCAEDGSAQVRAFVLTELLADNINKAFTIVEVQLALLHDYFFTNYHSTSSRSNRQAVIVGVVCTSIGTIVSLVLRCLSAGVVPASLLEPLGLVLTAAMLAVNLCLL